MVLGVQAYSILRGLNSLNESFQLEAPSPDVVSRPDYRGPLPGTTILSDLSNQGTYFLTQELDLLSFRQNHGHPQNMVH